MSAYHKNSEEQLISNLKLGHHGAFTEIFNRYWEPLAIHAYSRLRSREDAEDVVQSVFVSLYSRREELQLNSSLEAYLKTALKYKIIDTYRLQQKHYLHVDKIINETNLLLSTPEEYTELKELENTILIATNKLPEKCKQVFVMSRYDQLSHQEISEKTGSSISTIKNHINKALKILKSKIS